MFLIRNSFVLLILMLDLLVISFNLPLRLKKSLIEVYSKNIRSDRFDHEPFSEKQKQNYKIAKLTTDVLKIVSMLPILKPFSVEAKGFKASRSIFSPNSPIYIVPQLPQSALINSLPNQTNSELVGQIQK